MPVDLFEIAQILGMYHIVGISEVPAHLYNKSPAAELPSLEVELLEG